jgi:hypothetical protein
MYTATNVAHHSKSVISSAAEFAREADKLAKSRNLLLPLFQQQVPRLRSAIREADDGPPLGMTLCNCHETSLFTPLAE